MNFGAGRSTYAGGYGPPLVPAAGSIDPRAMSSKWLRYVYDDFRYSTARAIAGGAASGATAAVNEWNTGNRFAMPYQQTIIGAGQTIIIPPILAAGTTQTTVGGANIGLDQTATEGAMYHFGAPSSGVARGPLAFTTGSDRAFFAKWTIGVDDVSGVLPLLVGFIKAQAFTATLADYTDVALIGLADETGNISTVTDNDNAGDVTTDTGLDWADAATKTLAVAVGGPGATSAAGTVSFYVNGSLVRSTPSFAFDSGDTLVPVLFFINGSDLAGEVIVQEFESGLQAPQGS